MAQSAIADEMIVALSTMIYFGPKQRILNPLLKPELSSMPIEFVRKRQTTP